MAPAQLQQIIQSLAAAQTAVRNARDTVRNSRHQHIELQIASLRVDEAVTAVNELAFNGESLSVRP